MPSLGVRSRWVGAMNKLNNEYEMTNGFVSAYAVKCKLTEIFSQANNVLNLVTCKPFYFLKSFKSSY